MEQVAGGHHRVVILVAVALVAHVWMLHADMAPGTGPPNGHAAASTVATRASLPDLPTGSICAAGSVACLVTDPDDRPAAVTLALLVALGQALWALRRHLPDVHPHPTRRRAERCPPRSPVPASVVLRQ